MLEIHKPVYSMSFRTITAKAFRLYIDTLKKRFYQGLQNLSPEKASFIGRIYHPGVGNHIFIYHCVRQHDRLSKF